MMEWRRAHVARRVAGGSGSIWFMIGDLALSTMTGAISNGESLHCQERMDGSKLHANSAVTPSTRGLILAPRNSLTSMNNLGKTDC